MTYGTLKNIVNGLMSGDTVPPKDPEVYLGLLEYAFNMIADKAEALHLLTLNKNEEISRLATGDYLMRFPTLPATDLEELDIDHELGFVAARYIAAMISKDRIAIHQQYGDDGILKYNGKVYQILEKIKRDAENCKENDACSPCNNC